MVVDPDPEHLTPDTVEEYFRAAAPTAFQLSVKRQVSLEIDPGRQQLRLSCPVEGDVPDVTSFARISIGRSPLAGRNGEWFVLSIDATGIHYEAYALVESIVDQMRSGASFRNAISESLLQLKGLLASRKRMTEEKEAGLIGELLVLKHVILSEGEESALQSWLGPASEEHDFGFAHFDVEVKTTRSEDRVHRIGSETQLEPEPSRPLYLVSVQITLAGEASQGFSLGELVREIRLVLDSSRRKFDSALERVGWVDADNDLYTARFQERSRARGYLVDPDFPAITRSRLDEVIPQRIRVSAVSYLVDVTGLGSDELPAPLADFCEEN